MLANTLLIDAFEFEIESASFRFVAQSSSGPGWDFTFQASCRSAACQEMFPYAATLFAEAAPLPLGGADELVGVELWLPLPYDDESGEPLFGLQIGEEHSVSDMKLRFVQRNLSLYLIEAEATVARTVLGHPTTLKLSAWAAREPDHAYPA